MYECVLTPVHSTAAATRTHVHSPCGEGGPLLCDPPARLTTGQQRFAASGGFLRGNLERQRLCVGEGLGLCIACSPSMPTRAHTRTHTQGLDSPPHPTRLRASRQPRLCRDARRRRVLPRASTPLSQEARGLLYWPASPGRDGEPPAAALVVLMVCEPRESPRRADTGPPGADLTRP